MIKNKILFVSLLGMSSLAQGKVVELDCIYENLEGDLQENSLTIDLDKKTLKGGSESFTGRQVEITDEYVSAQKQEGEFITYIYKHQVSRVTLSYVYVFGVRGMGDPDRFNGQCEIVTRKRAF